MTHLRRKFIADTLTTYAFRLMSIEEAQYARGRYSHSPQATKTNYFTAGPIAKVDLS